MKAADLRNVLIAARHGLSAMSISHSPVELAAAWGSFCLIEQELQRLIEAEKTAAQEAG